MNPRSPWKDYAQTVLFTTGVTGVCVSAVAALQVFTQQRVRQNEAYFLKQAVYEAAGQPATRDRAQIEAWFGNSVQPLAGRDNAFQVQGSAPGETRGTVLVRQGAGLWGRITAVLGIAQSGEITGIAFTEQNETPGLGARIDEPWFKNQFRGKRPPLRFLPEGSRSSDPHEVDAITGATITTSAVQDIVKRAATEPPPRPEESPL